MTAPTGYDLSRLMTDEFVREQKWADLADAMSNIIYERVEENRIALSLAREPENIARTFKALSVKMLGLDYHSSVLTDDDYDRLLKFISIYNPEKGTKEFISFLGFIKNAKLDIIPLFTENYLDFKLGVPRNWYRVYDPDHKDDPKATYYATTHVGLVYDELITATIDTDELQRLFYKMAPINLVLKWIAAVITIYLPTVYLAVQFLDEDEIIIRAMQEYIAVLYVAVMFIEFETVIEANAPIEPVLATEMYVTLDAGGIMGETSYDAMHCQLPVYWDVTVDSTQPGNWNFTCTSPTTQMIEEDRILLVPPNQSRTLCYDNIKEVALGWFFEPKRTNYLTKSFDQSDYSWTQLRTVSSAFNISPDRKNPTTRVVKSGVGEGYVRQTKQTNVYGNWCASAVIREVSSRYAALTLGFLGTTQIVRGIVIDLLTGQAVLTTTTGAAINAEAGVVSLGDDFYQVWITMNNAQNFVLDFRVYPAWANSLIGTMNTASVGAIEIFGTQLEPGTRPTSVIRTGNAATTRNVGFIQIPDAVNYVNQNFFVIFDYNSLFADMAEPQTLFVAYQTNGGDLFRIGIKNKHLNVFFRTGQQEYEFISPNPIRTLSKNKFGIAVNPFSRIIRVFENGNKIVENDFFPPSQTLQGVQIGCDIDGSNGMYGFMSRLIMTTLNLPDDQFQSMTSD